LNIQNYDNHTKIVPGFHYLLVPLCFTTVIAAVTYGVISFLNSGPVFAAVLLTVLSLIVTCTVFFLRAFVCKVQDRAIRAEQNLRSYVLTGKLLDSRLTMEQIIALRFAGDEVFPPLCEKSVRENMTPDTIKKSGQHWKADHHRV
jgi:uncharacterized membrane protein